MVQISHLYMNTGKTIALTTLTIIYNLEIQFFSHNDPISSAQKPHVTSCFCTVQYSNREHLDHHRKFGSTVLED